MSPTLPQILILAVAVACGIGAPVWAAQRAAPLGGRPFRWGAWLALQTALVSGACIAVAFLAAARTGGGSGTSLALVVTGGLGLAAAVTLHQRRRTGVVLILASEVAFLALCWFNLSADAGRAGLATGAVAALLGLIAANALYFRRRWSALSNDWARPPAPAQARRGRRRSRVVMGRREAVVNRQH